MWLQKDLKQLVQSKLKKDKTNDDGRNQKIFYVLGVILSFDENVVQQEHTKGQSTI